MFEDQFFYYGLAGLPLLKAIKNFSVILNFCSLPLTPLSTIRILLNGLILFHELAISIYLISLGAEFHEDKLRQVVNNVAILLIYCGILGLVNLYASASIMMLNLNIMMFLYHLLFNSLIFVAGLCLKRNPQLMLTPLNLANLP